MPLSIFGSISSTDFAIGMRRSVDLDHREGRMPPSASAPGPKQEQPDVPGFFAEILPAAISTIRRALSEDPSSVPPSLRSHAKCLMKDNSQDSTAVAGALVSAASEFFRVISAADVHKALDAQRLSAILIRIAYNRWQRRKRRDRALRTAVSLSPVENRAKFDPPAFSSDPAIFLEFSEQFDDLIDHLCKEMSKDSSVSSPN